MRAVLLALPGLVLAVAGLFHPAHLTYATSHTWWSLHVPGLAVFPLVGVALMALVWGRRDVVALLVVLASFGYATAYTGLDVISGISAGYVTERLGPGVPRPDEVRYLFAIGTPLGTVGSVSLLLATVLVVGDALWRWRLPALPAVLMVLGAYLVHTHHIYPPLGAGGMALIGLSTGWLGLVAQNSRSSASSIPRSAS